MSEKDDNHIGDVPIMTPAHDEIASFNRTKAKGSLVASLGEVPDGQTTAAGGSKGLMAVVIILLLVLAGWAGFLHMQLQATEQSFRNYELRIADLENRLSVTDESMSESGVATKVKIRELDTEIRKLWDNVWKKSKQKFSEYDATLAKHDDSINEAEQFIVSTKQQLSKNASVVAGLSEQLKKSEMLQVQVRENQQSLLRQERMLESAADKSNSANAKVAKLEIRVKDTEEWVESINGFRRQVNRDINALKQGVAQP